MKQTKIFNWVILSLLFLLLPLRLSAQTIDITGTVTDEGTGMSLPGVTISVKGTTLGAVTDFDGKYTIKVLPGNVLAFSYIGYSPVEITVENETVINVSMQEELQSLDEVVVIGYGVQKKSDKTGAVASIQADELNTGVLSDPYQALQGKIAGVNISKKGGDPNAGFSIKIRGSSGFASNTTPLVVVDGVPGVDITTVSPDDIASFNVLKDASSTAIYGARGANGVVIIETKKGLAGETSNFEFSSNIAFDQVAKRLDMLSADQIRQYVADNNLNFTDGNGDTDWQDEIYRKGISQTYSVAASGSSKQSNYRVSLSQNDWQGVIKGSDKNRTTGRINLQQKAMNDKLTVSATLAGTFEKNNYISYGASGSNDVLYQTFQRNPTDPVYDSDGNFYEIQRDFNYYNPVALIEQIQNTRDAKKLLGNLKTDLEIFEGLIAGVNLGYIRDDSESWYFEPTTLRGGTTAGFGKRGYSNYESKLIETTLQYFKDFGEQKLSAVLGYSYQEDKNDGLNVQGRAPNSNILQAYNISTLTDIVPGSDVSSYYNTNKLVSFFGRVVYNYSDKYYVTATLRRDGSTRFGANNPWGWFPSGSLAWNMKKEGFLENVSAISNLKVRIGIGMSGNQEIGNFASIMVVQAGGTGTNFETGETTTAYNLPHNENPNLQWETNKEINAGLDFGFLNNRLTGSFEYYYKLTDNMLAKYAVDVPPNIIPLTWANAGSMLNQGIELYFDYFAFNSKNFNWKTSFTFAKNMQKIISMDNPENGFEWSDKDKKEGWLSGRGLVGDNNWTQLLQEGYAIGSFYMPEYAGLSSDGKFLFFTAAGGVTRNVESAERRLVGTALPDFEIGWSNYFTFLRNFDASISLRALYGNDVLNVTRMVFENPTILPSLNALESVFDEVERGVTDAPKVNSYYLEDGSFLKIDNISIGYNVKFNENEWIKNLRISFTANNLYTFTKYTGLDPETSFDGLSFGLDMYNVYPKTRSISLGVKATF